jgi:mRNA (2'-O-methyladenosine-N6-)-methyltransferase
MEEFEAPQWCVPIKANVMNFDWDVSDARPANLAFSIAHK